MKLVFWAAAVVASRLTVVRMPGWTSVAPA